MIHVKQSLFDRAIAAVSPGIGARRLAARAAYQAATSLTSAASMPVEPGGRVIGRGGYRGGQSDRRATRGWFARMRSANQDNAQRKTIVARSMDAAMNMPLATAAIERPIDFTVGTGLMAIPEIDGAAVGLSDEEAAALNARIAKDYDEYMSSTDPDAERTATGYELQNIVMRGVMEAGDIAGLRCMPEDQVGRETLTAWKLVEAYRIVSPVGHMEGEKLAGSGNVCTHGVEVDAYGAPVALHVLKKAPDGPAGPASRTSGDTVRIAVWGEKSGLPTALHVMSKRRAEQARGVPILAPVIEILKQVSDLTDAELFAAILQGMLAIIYKTPGAQAMPEPDYGDDAGVETGSGLDNPNRPLNNYRLESGSVMEIDSDAEVDLKTPGRPNPAFDPFFLGLVRQISAATRVPYEILLLHFTASYSASRGALEVFYTTVVRPYREWLSSHWCAPGYRCWLWEQVASGRYRMPGFLTNARRRAAWSAVRFKGDGKISLDMGREAAALEKYEAHGWATGAQITAELNGGDYDTNVRTRIAEHKRFVEGGLPIPNQQGGGNAPAPSADRREED